MTTIVALVRENTFEDERWTDYYTIDKDQNPEESLRAAVREFLLTDDGKNAIKNASNQFNWGDAVLYVPGAILKQHGLQEIADGESISFTTPFVVEVDQNENLIPDEYGQAD